MKKQHTIVTANSASLSSLLRLISCTKFTYHLPEIGVSDAICPLAASCCSCFDTSSGASLIGQLSYSGEFMISAISFWSSCTRWRKW